jgi:hypothetical protein
VRMPVCRRRCRCRCGCGALPVRRNAVAVHDHRAVVEFGIEEAAADPHAVAIRLRLQRHAGHDAGVGEAVAALAPHRAQAAEESHMRGGSAAVSVRAASSRPAISSGCGGMVAP